ncbi:MAG: CcoQ/FixQ family Cbb3-type cytochrome c oxidase assembly chaperone [Cytophagaceae bacterium]
MLKFIKSHMSEIGGIEIYPVISFVIFFSFFVVMLIWVFKVNKGFIDKMKQLPLDEDDACKDSSNKMYHSKI